MIVFIIKFVNNINDYIASAKKVQISRPKKLLNDNRNDRDLPEKHFQLISQENSIYLLQSCLNKNQYRSYELLYKLKSFFGR